MIIVVDASVQNRLHISVVMLFGLNILILYWEQIASERIKFSRYVKRFRNSIRINNDTRMEN